MVSETPSREGELLHESRIGWLNPDSASLHALQPLIVVNTPAETNSRAPAGQRTTSFPTCSVAKRTTLPFPALPPAAPEPASDGHRTPEKGNRSRSGSNASLASIGAGLSSVISGIAETKLAVDAKQGRLNPFAGLFGARERDRKGETPEGRTEAAELPEVSSRMDGDKMASGTELSSSVTLDGQKTPTAESQAALAPSALRPDSPSTPDGFQVPAWIIDHTIKYPDITRSMGKAINQRIKDDLDGVAPEKLADRIIGFVAATHPCFASETASLLSVGSSAEALNFQNADEASSTYQRFMGSVYDELYAHHLAAAMAPKSPVLAPSALSGLRRKGSKGKAAVSPRAPAAEAENDPARERDEKAKWHAAEESAEETAIAGTDRVEQVLCDLFYIRYARSLPSGLD